MTHFRRTTPDPDPGAADLVPFWARQHDIPAEPDDTDDPWRET